MGLTFICLNLMRLFCWWCLYEQLIPGTAEPISSVFLQFCVLWQLKLTPVLLICVPSVSPKTSDFVQETYVLPNSVHNSQFCLSLLLVKTVVWMALPANFHEIWYS